MTEKTVGKNVEDIKFTCLNSRCIPSRDIPQDAYNTYKRKRYYI